MIIEAMMENNLVRHYSDQGKRIRQVETGAIYDEAVDVVPCRYTYSETEDLVETTDSANPFSEQVAQILMGEDG